jgi:hypothetical protein
MLDEILNEDVMMIILTMNNELLKSAQLLNKRYHELTKYQFVYNLPLTPGEINDYVRNTNCNYRINCGGYHKTKSNGGLFVYVQNIYMIKDNSIVLNSYYKQYTGPVGPCGIYDFDYNNSVKMLSTYVKINVKCEIDFITQCKIYQERFKKYNMIVDKKIIDLLYTIVDDFKLYNDVSYSYLYRSLDINNISNEKMLDYDFITLDTNDIVKYIYDKIMINIKEIKD